MADHHVGHFLGVCVLCRHIADELTVAQNGDAVGKLLDLVHLVRYYNDRLARVTHVAQNSEELIGLLRSEHRRRLIEDEDIRAAIEDLYYLDGLLLRNAHLVNMLVGVDVKAVSVADLADLFCRCLEVELALTLETEDDILRRRENVDELEVLVDHADAEVERILGGAYDDLFIVDEYLALVGEIDAREHIHEGGLARSVLAEKRKYLASVYIEPNLVVSFYRAEGFTYVSHLHGGVFIIHLVSPDV